ncbi:MAG: protein translocase subunit SecD [Actinomycetota bacterium]|nr:protein translocase subunit SecD [Actinomycetota bacterium]MDD5665980.1 protein translocase subunit SecD [Actinomycetota bacterium]
MKTGRALIYLAVVAALLLGMYLPIIIGGYSPSLGLDLEGGVSVTLQAVGEASKEQVEKASDIVRNRVNALGLAGPVVAAQGNNRILVQIPGIQDTERVLSIIGSTAQLQFREVLEMLEPGQEGYDELEVTVPDPEDIEAYQSLKDQEIVLTSEGPGGEVLKIRMGPTRLTGDIIADAQPDVDDEKGGYRILFQLTDEAAQQFSELTTEMVGKQLAIVLDYSLESFPVVNEPIPGGEGVISGDFSREDARDLALVLRMGALPVEFEPDPLVETISATLGRDSLRQGLIAGLVGIVLVVLYMLFMYRGLGVVTTLSLAVFGLFIYGIICLLGQFIDWKLTLAGIAGVVVSIGISADSSVVYFERLKEEVRDGKTLRSGVDRAYKSAFRTIIAADAATFITAFILWILAMGSVKGFAFTLGIATILDVFISYFFTHPMVSLLSRLETYNKPRLIGVGREASGSEA